MRAWWALGLAWALVACTDQGRAPSTLDGWSRRGERYAAHFQVWQRGDDRLLLVFGDTAATDTAGIYFLGKGNDVPLGAIRLGELDRIALSSTTHASFLSALGRSSAVVACAYLDQVLDTALLRHVREGHVQEIGGGDGIDRERMIALHADVLFTYPFGRTTAADGRTGPPAVEVTEYLEEHPLGRAEWLRFFGTLLRKEHLADSLFDGIARRYLSVKASVPPVEARPVVFFGSAWKGQWSVPSGTSYMARLIADAQGRYLFATRGGTGNIDLDMETALKEGAKADVWGRLLELPPPVTARDIADGDERVLRLKAFREGRCFYGNSMASDLFGEAGLRPDVMLADLVGILYPAAAEGRTPVYLKPAQ